MRSSQTCFPREREQEGQRFQGEKGVGTDQRPGESRWLVQGRVDRNEAGLGGGQEEGSLSRAFQAGRVSVNNSGSFHWAYFTAETASREYTQCLNVHIHG